MFNHVMLGCNHIDRSRHFYDSLAAAIGGRPGRLDDRGRLFYAGDGNLLFLSRPIDGGPATSGNGSTIGFRISSPARVDAWHFAGVTNGGTSIEDPPGLRERSFGPVYLAYLRDPDGNKLAGVCLMPH